LYAAPIKIQQRVALPNSNTALRNCGDSVILF
jgi:hypothetical protein